MPFPGLNKNNDYLLQKRAPRNITLKAATPAEINLSGFWLANTFSTGKSMVISGILNLDLLHLTAKTVFKIIILQNLLVVNFYMSFWHIFGHSLCLPTNLVYDLILPQRNA